MCPILMREHLEKQFAQGPGQHSARNVRFAFSVTVRSQHSQKRAAGCCETLAPLCPCPMRRKTPNSSLVVMNGNVQSLPWLPLTVRRITSTISLFFLPKSPDKRIFPGLGWPLLCCLSVSFIYFIGVMRMSCDVITRHEAELRMCPSGAKYSNQLLLVPEI